MARSGPWGQADRDDLYAARGALGHTQPQCAARLVELGLRADQSDVSKWISGVVQHPRADTVRILRLYIDEGLAAARAAGDTSSASDTTFDDQFQSAVSDFTNEPLLGPRQGALVDALIERLGTGPLNEFDEAVRQDLFEVLNMRRSGLE